jgi:hypothetical protein
VRKVKHGGLKSRLPEHGYVLAETCSRIYKMNCCVLTEYVLFMSLLHSTGMNFLTIVRVLLLGQEFPIGT